MNKHEHASHTAETLLQQFRSCIPSYAQTASPHSVILLGGNLTHAGAIYRIGVTALRSGANGVHAYCPPETAGPLSALAPDIYCTATLRVSDMSKASALVVGPGLGQSKDGAKCVADALQMALSRGLPCVLDASSMYDLARSADVRKALLGAPDAAPPPIIVGDKDEMSLLRSAPALLGHLCFVQWGDIGLCSIGDIRCTVGGPTEKGLLGIHHVLLGCATTFAIWAYRRGLGGRFNERAASAITAAMCVTRHASRFAFERFGRALMVSDVIDEIGVAVGELEKGQLSATGESSSLFPIQQDTVDTVHRSPIFQTDLNRVHGTQTVQPPYSSQRSMFDDREQFDPSSQIHLHLHGHGSGPRQQ